ncbi:MAG: TauD/TfdA family dioxygenase [Verrucomicrobiota bacterium]
MHLAPKTGPLSAVDHASLKSDLTRDGAVLLRDQNADLAAFASFSDSLGADFVAPGEGLRIVGGNSGRKNINGYKGLFTVSGTSQSGYGHEVPLHGELYFHSHHPPDLLWFFCKNPSQSGGETLLCDGVELFEHLPTDLQAALQTRDIEYERNHDQSTWTRLYKTDCVETLEEYCRESDIALQLNSDGGITTRFRCSPLRQKNGRTAFINNFLPFALRQMREPERTNARIRFADGETIPEPWVLAIEAVAAELSVPVAWEKGDVAIVDNHRTLHGRQAVTDPDRDVYVRMSAAGALR